MERQYIERKPTDLEIEKYTFTERDEKNIPLATFEPVKILEYRNHIFPIYVDEPSQAFFVRFEDDEWSNPMGYCEDFCDFLDSKLDSLVADRPIQVLHKELSDFSYELLKLVRATEMGDTLYLKFKSLEKDVHKYLELMTKILPIVSPDYDYVQDLEPLVKDQLNRVAVREFNEKYNLTGDKALK